MDSIETLKKEIAKLTHRSRVLEFANETLGRYVREGQEEKAEWKVRAIQAERERDEARQANAALLECVRHYADKRNHEWSDKGERARQTITQYDTAPKEDTHEEDIQDV